LHAEWRKDNGGLKGSDAERCRIWLNTAPPPDRTLRCRRRWARRALRCAPAKTGRLHA